MLERRFRVNPAFELVPPERLPERLRPDPGDVVLLPKSMVGVTAKVLNGAAARLVEGLAATGRLPSETRARGGGAANEAVARLVLDGAIEIEHDDRFLTGPRAHAAVFAAGPPVAATGPLGELSLRAIRYGQALGIADVGVLSHRLYGYGTIPRSPRWERLLDSDVGGHIGASPALAAYEATATRGWLAWSRMTERPSELPFKLYVSPKPEALMDCLPTVAGVLAEHDVWSFKVGRGVQGVLRADKLVAYLEDFDRLERLAGALAGALDGVPAHGVPFTVEASADGLLSWGMDPPSTERVVSAQPEESWRLWVTNRLAGGLIHAQAAGGDVEPSTFALDRLALEGVDPSTWLPATTIWPRRGEQR